MSDAIERTGECGYVVTAIDHDPENWTDLPAFFSAVESAGADTIWLTDHLFSGHRSAEAFVAAAVAATATRRCRIGTGILQLALRRPAAVAKAAATLQLVSGGRFVLGVGAGQHRREFERTGVDFDGRGEAMDRALREMSEFWQLGDGWFEQRPSATVPIWFGGVKPPAMRRVTESGDGWLALFLSPERFAQANTRLDEMLGDAGRSPTTVERRIVLFTSPTDSSWTRTDALAWIARQFPAGTKGVDRHLITGSVDECSEAIGAFLDAGADGVDLQITHPDPLPRFAALRSTLSSSNGR